MRLIVQTYEQSRLEFFEELKKHHERKLHWWKHQKPYKKGLAHCDPMAIHEKCSYHGEAIQYCEDAIKALQEPVRHGRWVGYWNGIVGKDQMHCTLCQHYIWYTDGFELGLPKYCPNCGAKMDGGAGDAAD